MNQPYPATETDISRFNGSSASEKDRMWWYFETAGGHTHVRVFMNGGKCGDLVFRNDEFEHVRRESNRTALIKFVKEAH